MPFRRSVKRSSTGRVGLIPDTLEGRAVREGIPGRADQQAHAVVQIEKIGLTGASFCRYRCRFGLIAVRVSHSA